MFEITNRAENGAEVDLTNPANGAIYDELENIGPGTTAPMALDVGGELKPTAAKKHKK